MRPTILHVGGTLYWVIRTYNPDTSVLKDADSTPTVAVRKNGASTGDSVTVTKRSATTGIYDCSYNPASEVEGDEFVIEETATVTGTTTSQATYSQSWSFTVTATTGAIADAVLTESVLDHRNVDHSFAKYIYQIRQANLTIDGTVSNAITPTTLTFASNVSATTSAYAHAVLLFTTGPLAGENSPIISYNSTNGVFVLEEPLTAAPSNGDEFVVIAGSHVHSVADIQSGLATAAAITTLRGADNDTLKTISDQIDGLNSGGLTVDQAAALTRIDNKTALITGAKLSVAGAVTPGGDITIVIGDDRLVAADSELIRTITDTSGALFARLDDAASITFGAGRNGFADLITGTVTAAYASNVTTLTIEIDHADISADAIDSEDYTYQIQRITSGGDCVIEVSGNLTLLTRYVSRG